MDLGHVIELSEQKRTYIYEKRDVVIENVVELIVRESGTHRLKTSDNVKYIMSSGWLAIKIDSDKDWVV